MLVLILAALAVATVCWIGPLIARTCPEPGSTRAFVGIAAWAAFVLVALTTIPTFT